MVIFGAKFPFLGKTQDEMAIPSLRSPSPSCFLIRASRSAIYCRAHNARGLSSCAKILAPKRVIFHRFGINFSHSSRSHRTVRKHCPNMEIQTQKRQELPYLVRTYPMRERRTISIFSVSPSSNCTSDTSFESPSSRVSHLRLQPS
jgi:hypothetical protein